MECYIELYWLLLWCYHLLDHCMNVFCVRINRGHYVQNFDHISISFLKTCLKEDRALIAINTSRVRKWIYPILLALLGFRACKSLDFRRPAPRK